MPQLSLLCTGPLMKTGPARSTPHPPFLAAEKGQRCMTDGCPRSHGGASDSQFRNTIILGECIFVFFLQRTDAS